MAKFVLEWRQSTGAASAPFFVHRVVYASSNHDACSVAKQVGDRAWRREFRVARGAEYVFTNAHEIENWAIAGRSLPAASTGHVWRQDLEKDLTADRFLAAVAKSTPPAVAAGVLGPTDAETLVRFARSAVQRPRL